jgi:LysR family hca operon transcriptional activator
MIKASREDQVSYGITSFTVFCCCCGRIEFYQSSTKNVYSATFTQSANQGFGRRSGVQLLLRSNRKVELTEEGRAFLKEALLCLRHSEKAIEDARQVAKLNHDYLNIGFVPVAEMKVFPYIMPNIRAHFPNLHINFQSLTDASQFQALKKGDIDIAFTRYTDNSQEFESFHIFQEPLALIVPKSSPAAQLKQISIKSFNQQDFIVSEEVASPQLHKIIKDFLNKKKLPPILFSIRIIFY